MSSKALQEFKEVIRGAQHKTDTKLLYHSHRSLCAEHVHISIDDVYNVFIQAVNKNPVSIFSLPLLSDLKELNKKYGSKFTLYCFEDKAARLNKTYCDELIENSEWIKLGYHADLNGTVTVDGFQRFYDYYATAGLQLAKTLRLHLFSTPVELFPILKRYGVSRLLCADDKRISYGLLPNFYETGYMQDGIEFIPTDMRLEHMVNRLMHNKAIASKQELFVFGHELPFIRYRECEKLEAIIQLLPEDVKYDY